MEVWVQMKTLILEALWVFHILGHKLIQMEILFFSGGCTDSTASNYNSNACFDDGSCIAVVEGCTDFSACNYNSDANVNDGTCLYGGSVTFTKLDNTDINLAENRDIIIEGAVEITRGSYGPIYNYAQSSYAYNDGIAWKYGSIDSEYELESIT